MTNNPDPAVKPNYLLAQRATINPYRNAAKLVFDRLRWDISWESFRSRRILRSWQDRFPGQKAVILCNGPSLLQSDLSSLKGRFTFGLNKINLLFDRDPFRPDCVVALNPHVIEQNCAFFNQTDIPLFLDGESRGLVRSRSNVAFLHSSNQLKMARDCSMSVMPGFTVTYVALQLAFHMGFRDVALIGCDHNFAHKGPASLTVASGEKDLSHFDPRYFSGGQQWQLPDLAASEYFYSLAAETYNAYKGRIVNCTVGGKLEIFQRMPLETWLIK
jgi:hypothetical protein